MTERLEKAGRRRSRYSAWRKGPSRATGAAALFSAFLVLWGSGPGSGRVQASPDVRVLPHTREEVQLSYAPLVRQVAPAVVNIYSLRPVRQAGHAPLLDDPFLRNFFGDEGPLAGAERQHLLRSLGSGVIVDSKGLVVTSSRLLAGQQAIGVALSDGREFAAKLVLTDPDTELAVLSIEGGNGPFPALSLRDSDELEVGDLVLAVGDPFDGRPTVTSGILSALEPAFEHQRGHYAFIRTDAVISPANAGGALVTMDGQLAGITALIRARSGGVAGVGFVIPANLVARVVQAALSGHGIVRAWVGADFAPPATADLAIEDDRTGLRVTAIYPGGPAELAGIRVGDGITAVDGHGIFGRRSLRFAIAAHPVGERVLVTLERNGKSVDLPLVLQAPPDRPLPDFLRITGDGPLAGTTVGNLSPALADRLDADRMTKGVVITEVAAGSPADRLRLLIGDRIESVDGTKVTSTQQLRSLVAVHRRRWSIVVLRGSGPTRFVVE